MNTFLDAILKGVHAAVVVLDPELRIIEWNRRAEDLWGLRSDEVDHVPLLNLRFGLPLIHRSSTDGGHQTATIPATNRLGEQIRCHISCSVVELPNLGHGYILMMEPTEDG